MRRRNAFVPAALRGLLVPVAAAVLLVAFSTAFDHLDSDRSAEDLAQLEAAIRRSCVACYAAEGRYPQDLTYLKDHYGLQVDEERYVVHYNVFASNWMPDITVLELGT